MPHRASHWIWSCRNSMRMEVHLESVLPPPLALFNFSDCLRKCSEMLARKGAKWRLKRSQSHESEAKTASKDSQTKPGGPQRDLVEKRISF